MELGWIWLLYTCHTRLDATRHPLKCHTIYFSIFHSNFKVSCLLAVAFKLNILQGMIYLKWWKNEDWNFIWLIHLSVLVDKHVILKHQILNILQWVSLCFKRGKLIFYSIGNTERKEHPLWFIWVVLVDWYGFFIIIIDTHIFEL